MLSLAQLEDKVYEDWLTTDQSMDFGDYFDSEVESINAMMENE